MFFVVVQGSTTDQIQRLHGGTRLLRLSQLLKWPCLVPPSLGRIEGSTIYWGLIVMSGTIDYFLSLFNILTYIKRSVFFQRRSSGWSIVKCIPPAKTTPVSVPIIQGVSKIFLHFVRKYIWSHFYHAYSNENGQQFLNP